MNEMITTTSTLQAPKPFDALADEYIDFLQVKEVTAKSYIVCIRCFMEWLYDNGITHPTNDDIRQYALYLDTPHAIRKGNRESMIKFVPGTQQRYLRAVKSFFRWLSVKGKYPNVADGVKSQTKVRANIHKRDALSSDGTTKLLESIDRTTPAGKRDYAMILLSITAALRIIEMQRASIEDLETLDGEPILYIMGKGHDERDAYKKLTAEVVTAINEYLKTREHADKHAPLFASVGNRSMEQRLTEPSIARIIKNRMIAAGFNTHRISAHSLRHTSVTLYLESGATLQEAQQHARHAKIETTTIYAHNIDQRKEHPEQQIYNYLFGIEGTMTEKALDCFKKMNAAQQEKALAILQAIAE